MEEEPTWLDVGRCGGSSGGLDPSQLWPGIERSTATNKSRWENSRLLDELVLVLTDRAIFLGMVDFSASFVGIFFVPFGADTPLPPVERLGVLSMRR